MMSYAQIAKEIGSNENAVRRAVNRALSKLKKQTPFALQVMRMHEAALRDARLEREGGYPCQRK